MALDDEFLVSREELLGGLPTRRASMLLFTIESRTAALVAQARQAMARHLTPKTAEEGERAFLQALAMGRDLPLQPTRQVPGEAMRLKTEMFREEVNRGGSLVRILQRYTYVRLVEVAQLTVCNRLHSIEERCAYWLLTTRDRVANDKFTLTQEFLGQMLGVCRASVNGVMRAFQQAGLVGYRRGNVMVLNRTGLKAKACECYRRVRQEYKRIFADISAP